VLVVLLVLRSVAVWVAELAVALAAVLVLLSVVVWVAEVAVELAVTSAVVLVVQSDHVFHNPRMPGFEDTLVAQPKGR